MLETLNFLKEEFGILRYDGLSYNFDAYKKVTMSDLL